MSSTRVVVWTRLQDVRLVVESQTKDSLSRTQLGNRTFTSFGLIEFHSLFK